MFFSAGYVESERQRMPQCSTEENDILRELLLDGDFASPRHPIPLSTRHLGLGKRQHHVEVSIPQISFDHTPLGRLQPPLSLSNRSNPPGPPSSLHNTPSGSLPSSIMNAIISPPRVFIQEFARLPPPFFNDGMSSMLDSDIQDAKPAKSVPPIISSLPPPPLPMLSMPPLKKKKPSSVASSSANSTPSFNGNVTPNSGADTPSERKQLRCSFPECPNLRRSAGFCNRHSGKICSVSGCNKSALSRGKCPEHGGGSRCKRDGCQKFAQTRGLCKSHGGGRQCNVPGCTKNAHQNRLCRSHGGGKRCDFYGCPKWAQRSGYCCAHTKLGQSVSSTSSGLPPLQCVSSFSSSSGGMPPPPPILSPPLMSPHRLLSLLP
ncbi:hypothetical protein PINS_up014687 [Pythium insidiosum]|nr:hypothetical protein PINS_up014687 [Pythium insidiosum]